MLYPNYVIEHFPYYNQIQLFYCHKYVLNSKNSRSLRNLVYIASWLANLATALYVFVKLITSWSTLLVWNIKILVEYWNLATYYAMYPGLRARMVWNFSNCMPNRNRKPYMFKFHPITASHCSLCFWLYFTKILIQSMKKLY